MKFHIFRETLLPSVLCFTLHFACLITQRISINYMRFDLVMGKPWALNFSAFQSLNNCFDQSDCESFANSTSAIQGFAKIDMSFYNLPHASSEIPMESALKIRTFSRKKWYYKTNHKGDNIRKVLTCLLTNYSWYK